MPGTVRPITPTIGAELFGIDLERPRTEGMTDLEYIGNVALAQWDAPPPEVLRHLGLE